MYKFYVKIDGDDFGPYSARELKELDLTEDILVTEAEMNEWLPYSRFDVDAMIKKELEEFINPDGTIRRPSSISNDNMQRQHIVDRYDSNEENTFYSQTVPDIIKKWNWGAFFFSWLWGLFNGVYWPLILIVTNFIPYVGWLLTLIGCIVLGINGNEWSWKGKYWSSIAEFKRVQHNWSVAVLWVFVGSLVIGFIIGIASY